MLTLRRGDSHTLDITVDTDLTGAALKFTVKTAVADDDGDAVFQKTIGAGISVTDAANGVVEVNIGAADLDAIQGGTYLVYDLQLERAGEVRTLAMASLLVLPDVTRGTG